MLLMVSFQYAWKAARNGALAASLFQTGNKSNSTPFYRLKNTLIAQKFIVKLLFMASMQHRCLQFRSSMGSLKMAAPTSLTIIAQDDLQHPPMLNLLLLSSKFFRTIDV